MKIAINQWTIKSHSTQTLIEAQSRTKDRRKIAAIQAELDLRKAAGSGDRTPSIEDYL